MKKDYKSTQLVNKTLCNLIGHDYHVSKKITSHVKEYTCSRCGKQLTTNSNGQLVELTPKFKEINSILAHIYKSKLNRSKKKIISSSIC